MHPVRYPPHSYGVRCIGQSHYRRIRPAGWSLTHHASLPPSAASSTPHTLHTSEECYGGYRPPIPHQYIACKEVADAARAAATAAAETATALEMAAAVMAVVVMAPETAAGAVTAAMAVVRAAAMEVATVAVVMEVAATVAAAARVRVPE